MASISDTNQQLEELEQLLQQLDNLLLREAVRLLDTLDNLDNILRLQAKVNQSTVLQLQAIVNKLKQALPAVPAISPKIPGQEIDEKPCVD